MLALYIERDSLVHRLPAAWKLAALFASGIAATILTPLWALGGLCVFAVFLFVLARLPLGAIAAALQPLLLIATLIFALQWWLSGVDEAFRALFRICALVLLASLVTLTTPFSEMIGTLTRFAGPLRRFGLSPARFGLAAALVIRFIPVLMNDYREIEAARAARCARFPAIGAAGPLLIKTLRMTDMLSDAITARGFELRDEAEKRGERHAP